MRAIRITLFFLIVTGTIWGLDVNITNVNIENSRIQIVIDVLSSHEIFLPINVVQDEIFTTTDPFERDIQIFHGKLKLNERGQYTLILSNEKTGILKYINIPFGNSVPLLTIDTEYIPYTGSSTSIIILSSISRIRETTEQVAKTEITVDEIYLEYCFSTDVMLRNETPGNLAKKIQLIENTIKTVSCYLRLENPLIINDNMIRY